MKFYLFKHNLPVKKCAADLQISTSYLYQILSKERKPSLALALKIEHYTQGEVTVNDLLGDHKDPEPQELDGCFLEEIKKVVDEEICPIRKYIDEIDNRLKKLENSG